MKNNQNNNKNQKTVSAFWNFTRNALSRLTTNSKILQRRTLDRKAARCGNLTRNTGKCPLACGGRYCHLFFAPGVWLQ